MWDLINSSLTRDPTTSPTWQGEFLTPGPPGKPLQVSFIYVPHVMLKHDEETAKEEGSGRHRVGEATPGDLAAQGSRDNGVTFGGQCGQLSFFV